MTKTFFFSIMLPSEKPLGTNVMKNFILVAISTAFILNLSACGNNAPKQKKDPNEDLVTDACTAVTDALISAQVTCPANNLITSEGVRIKARQIGINPNWKIETPELIPPTGASSFVAAGFVGTAGIGQLKCFYSYKMPGKNTVSNDFITVDYQPSVLISTPPCKKHKGYIYNWEKNAENNYQCTQNNPKLCAVFKSN